MDETILSVEGTVSEKLSVRDLDVADRRVFCRVDFNVPLEDGRVSDDRRIAASLPTIRLLLERGARLVLGSHIGRPKGAPKPGLSLAPVGARLSELLGQEVPLAPDCVGPEAEALAAALAPGRALLLENLRFHPGEEKNDEAFAARLAALAELYVNDAFGTAHRAHASTVGVARRLPRAAAGLLMDAELRNLSVLMIDPARPYAIVLGGAKVSDKIALIRNLMVRADRILIGGAMAYTFLRARGIDTGDSRVEADQAATAAALMEEAAARTIALLLPSDHRIGPAAPESAAGARVTDGASIPAGWRGLDIGPKTIEAFCRALGDAKTILWNGPVGLFEQPPFDEGTRAVARAIAGSGAHSVVGGGDSAAAVGKFGLTGDFTHVSTGGGATLEYLSGMALPGVEALSDAAS